MRPRRPWTDVPLGRGGIAVLLLLLAGGALACRQESAGPQPPMIYYGEDLCDYCGMIISEKRFAAGAVVRLGDGRTETRKFDDIGGLFLYLDEHPELEVLARYVHDYRTGEWLPAEEAVYVFHPELHSPMGHNVAAFRDRSAAERFVRERGGEVIPFAELAERFRTRSFPTHTHEPEGTGP